MDRHTLILTFLSSLFLLSGCDSGFMSETVDYGELIERDGLYFEKFSDVPYTGKVIGEELGSMSKGLREGEWVGYYYNGQLESKENFKNGLRDGKSVWYHDNGNLWWKRFYNNDEIEGESVNYYDNGQLQERGTYKNGKREGEWVWYQHNGELREKETYRNGDKISD